jgi:hypothetical protein
MNLSALSHPVDAHRQTTHATGRGCLRKPHIDARPPRQRPPASSSDNYGFYLISSKAGLSHSCPPPPVVVLHLLCRKKECRGKRKLHYTGATSSVSMCDERGLLKEGGADHQPMVTRPSYKLATEANKRTSYHFYPYAFRKEVARFHHGVDRRHLLENGDFLNWNRFRSHSADNANDTRCL